MSKREPSKYERLRLLGDGIKSGGGQCFGDKAAKTLLAVVVVICITSGIIVLVVQFVLSLPF